MYQNEVAQNYSVEEVNSSSAQDAIAGDGLMQTRSPYSTAVQVIKKRNLQDVTQRCEVEAAIAGDEFYYSWSQGNKIIEGPTVGAALAIARNFGNCAVDVRVEEHQNATIFYGAFIDLETGFNIVRPFRQNNAQAKKKDGRNIYTDERGLDVKFQIGASKGIRNAVLNGVPKWLVNKVMVKAKENVVEKIKKMGVVAARDMVIKKLSNLSIPLERVEKVYQKTASWDIEKLVMLSGAIRSIEDGFESIETIFPDDTVPETNTTQPKTQPEQPKTGNTTPPPPAAPVNDSNDKASSLPPVESVETVKEDAPTNNDAKAPQQSVNSEPEPAPVQPISNGETVAIPSPDKLIADIKTAKDLDTFKALKTKFGKFGSLYLNDEYKAIIAAINQKENEFKKK